MFFISLFTVLLASFLVVICGLRIGNTLSRSSGWRMTVTIPRAARVRRSVFSLMTTKSEDSLGASDDATSKREISIIVNQIAEVQEQIREVAKVIEKVQEQISDVSTKLDATEIAIEKTNPSAKEYEIIMMRLKRYTVKEKGLMDEEKGLMDEKARLMDKEARLMDEKKSLKESMKSSTSVSFLNYSSNLIRKAEKKVLSSKGEAVIAVPRLKLRNYLRYDRIFVRDFYDRFIENKLKNFSWDEVANAGAVIMGTPGIGKSAFAWYVVWKALQMGKTVIYQHFFNPNTFLVFRGDMPVEVYNAFPQEYDDPNNVYVVDSLVPNTSSCFIVFVTSPDRELVKEFLKLPGTQRYFFPTYEFEEMKLLRDSCFDGCSADNQSNILSDKELEHRFGIFGGVPRFVLSDRSTLNSTVLISEMVSKASTQLKIGAVKPSNFYDLSHNIFHIAVSRDIPTWVEQVTFSSNKAAELLFDSDVSQKEGTLRSFLDFAWKYPEYGAMYGTAFETGIKRMFPSLKVLETKTMSGEDGIVVPLPGDELAYVKEFQNISEVSIGKTNKVTIWAPSNSKNPAFDLLVTRRADVYFIQATVSSTHGIVLRTKRGNDNGTEKVNGIARGDGLLDVVDFLQSRGFRVGGEYGINFVWAHPQKIFPIFQKSRKFANASVKDKKDLKDKHLKEFKVALNFSLPMYSLNQ